ncbi:peptidoglycan editing factor PgeF [Clostridium sp. NSJ-49]|uniref:Purine nucleoside phosphorylase n=1 Tax=Clostridium disporicum TaxID=84024 RepID=A0A173YRE3_9CLOT|nr:MULTISPECIES: peptidoglycan editing factor PgeF [Clostridium]MBC5623868.1 peptidoglycan editing factor PgeF [Clostridium sp. NSJ-49]MCD2501670.1 peptidoglycan editing factor PgeF [Clostridium sp. NSJ-145]MDU6340538.1 peptidoglycan editing factor PgeF [Clostridium sp.]CUN65776.1 multi-copper polyphenol oxidoreductase%2C laccase [Clostridium disporicum]
MKKININNLKVFKDFLVIEGEKVDVVFSTAKDSRSFNRNTEEGQKNINSLKEDFNVNEVVYLHQIHSDNVFVFEGDAEEFREYEGDSIITKEEKVIIGAFTADCVPVILVDEREGVIAAIHSGWKGTFNSITKKTIEKMIQEYDVKIENIKVYIGPHIRQCCYEVSEELKESFLNKTKINENELFKGRNLSMERCILEDLRNINIKEDNIYTINLCTYCEKDIKLFSYRKSVGTYGRLFTFAYKK